MNDIIRTTYSSDDFGTLRIIYDSGRFYYCAKDICRILKVTGHDTLSLFCKNVKKEVHETNGGLHVMNFLGIEDVMRVYKHSKSESAERFILSLFEIKEDFEAEFLSEDEDDTKEEDFDSVEAFYNDLLLAFDKFLSKNNSATTE